MTAHPAAKAMSEQQLDNQIRAIAKDLRLLRYHTHDSRKSPHGFPDLVLVGARGILFRELKKEGGKHTDAQLEWLLALSDAGSDAGTWYPSDLLSGRIAQELTAIAGLHVVRGAQ